MSVLLRQAKGFEGVGACGVGIEASDLAVADGKNGSYTARYLLSASLAEPTIPVEQKHSLSEVDRLLDFHPVRGPRCRPVQQESPEAIEARIAFLATERVHEALKVSVDERRHRFGLSRPSVVVTDQRDVIHSLIQPQDPVPRSPATSPAQYPAGSGVAVSVLLRA